MLNINVLDLFCGAGGLSCGFERAGYNIIAGIDNDIEALHTYKKNHKNTLVIQHDLSKNLLDVDSKDIINLKKLKIDVIVGGPPCQGMSIAGKRIGNDPRNNLYKAYKKLIEYYKPKVIVLENVPTIMSLFNGKIATAIVNDFSAQGYTVSIHTIFASDYGVPQKRKRTFFIGLLGNKFTFPIASTKNMPITTFVALSDLPLLEHNLGAPELEYAMPARNQYQKTMRNKSKKIYNHEAVAHTAKTKKIIAMVPDGGNYKNLPLELQKTRKVHIAWTRMNSKKPSFTIDAGHNHHFHYKANRVPTVRECARLQSFPDTFIFYGKRSNQYRQVGNAVPPILAKTIADELKRYLYV